MGILQSIAAWFLNALLEYLFTAAKNEVDERLEKARIDRERKEIDKINEQKLAEAVERKDRIKAATDLLNGDRPV